MARKTQAPILDADPLFDQKELAIYLGRPEGTLEQWRVRGGGPDFIRTGRLVRYRLSAVTAWLDANTHSVGAA